MDDEHRLRKALRKYDELVRRQRGLLAALNRKMDAANAEIARLRTLIRSFRDAVRYITALDDKESLATEAERVLGLAQTSLPMPKEIDRLESEIEAVRARFDAAKGDKISGC